MSSSNARLWPPGERSREVSDAPTRRAVVAGGLASAGLLATRSRAEAGDGRSYDVVIIGAGVAGIAAARACAKRKGVRYVVLEARDRPGGRTYTYDKLAAPVDVGAAFFQDVRDRPGHPGTTTNPLFDLARNKIELYPSIFDAVLYQQTRQVPFDSPVALGVAEASATMTALLDEAGAAIFRGERPDLTLKALFQPLEGDPYYNFATSSLSTEHGAPLSKISTVDTWLVSRRTIPFGVPSDDKWVTPTGIGAFVDTLAAKLNIMLETPVTAIDWRGRRILLTTSRGTIEAKTVIVTVPVGVLADERPKFFPLLPSGHRAAIAGLPMGAVARVAMEFSENVFDGLELNTMAAQVYDGPLLRVVQCRLWGKKVGTLIQGGPEIAALEKRGSRAVIRHAVDTLDKIIGHRPQRFFRRGYASMWTVDPWALGAYSHARPGDVALRAELAKPVDGRLFFAGEATYTPYPASINGAFYTGERAAHDALSEIPAGDHPT